MLARTDPSRPKFEGLTSFFIDMASPGVSVRPIRQPGGEADFNEVFLEEVFVPTASVSAPRGGLEGHAHRADERAACDRRRDAARSLAHVRHRAAAHRIRGGSAIADGRFRERLADLYLAEHGLWLLQCRALTALGRGGNRGRR